MIRPLKLFSLTIVALFSLSLTVVFNNCGRGFLLSKDYGQNSASYSLSSFGNPPLPHNHPDADPLVGSESFSVKPLFMNRMQVYSHLLSIYDGASLSGDGRNYLANVLREEILSQGISMGGACDYASGLDTNSVPGDCLREGNNPTTEMHTIPSVAREGFHAQACIRISANNEVIQNLTKNLQARSGNQSTEPNSVLLQTLFELFYPGQIANKEFVDGLLNMYALMKTDQVPLQECWKMLTLTVCQTTDWQKL